MSCVIEQQIHYRSKKKSFEKMLRKSELKELTLENFEVFEEWGLREVKLSERKFSTIAHLLDFFSKEKIDWLNCSDEFVRTQLGGIKGIGPWTVDMIMLYTLERKDVFPADDYHLKKAMSEAYKLNPNGSLKKQMISLAETWKPYRSIGTLYLLSWKEQKK